jgi:hypothetical protein
MRVLLYIFIVDKYSKFFMNLRIDSLA